MTEPLESIINFETCRSWPEDLCANIVFKEYAGNNQIRISNQAIDKINRIDYGRWIYQTIGYVMSSDYHKLDDIYVSKYGNGKTVYVDTSVFYKLGCHYYLFYYKMAYGEDRDLEIDILGLINIVTYKYIILGRENHQLFLNCNDFIWQDTKGKSPETFPNIDDSTKPADILDVMLKYVTIICSGRLYAD